MKDRIQVNTGRLGEWARELRTVQNELESIAGRLSQINLSDDAGGDLDRRGSYSMRTTGRRFSGNDVRQCVEALTAATKLLAASTGITAGDVQDSLKLFEEKERWISSMIDGLLANAGNRTGIGRPGVITPADIKLPPVLEFEDYNNVWDWLWRQDEKSRREAIIKLSDPFSNADTISLMVNGLVQSYKNLEEGVTTVLDDAGVSNGDRRAMANLMISEWAEQIKSGEIQVEGYEVFSEAVRLSEEKWESMNVEQRSRYLTNILSTIGMGSEVAGIVGTILEGTTEACVDNVKRISELAEAKLVIRAMQNESISVAGMDDDLHKEIQNTLNSSASYIDTALDMWVNYNGAQIDMVKDWAIGEILERASLKATEVVDVAAGWTLGEKASEYEALNSGISTLEGAVDVFTKDTRPQLDRAIENYRNSPTAENYQMLKEKAETYGAQAKAVSKQYYDVLDKTGEGKPGQYEQAIREIDAFVSQFK